MNADDLLALLAVTFPDAGLPTYDRRSGADRREKDDPLMAQHRRAQSRRRSHLRNHVGNVVDTITITSDDPPGMSAGQTFQLTWELSNSKSGATFAGNVLFTTSDAGVATVSSTGLVTAVGGGTATITVIAAHSRVTATVAVTVQASQVPDALNITTAPFSIQENLTRVIYGNVEEAGVPLTGQTGVTWDTDDHNVGTMGIDSNPNDPTHQAVFSAVAPGSCNIQMIKSGLTTDTIAVTVTAAPAQAGNVIWLQDFNYADTTALKSTATANVYVAGVHAGWWTAEDSGMSNIDLALGAHASTTSPTGNSMHYNFPDRTAEGIPGQLSAKGYCGDKTIGRAMKFATPVVEIWSECHFKLSDNFTIEVPYCTSTNASTAGLKFWFHCVTSPNVSRFDSLVYPNTMRAFFPSFQCPSGNHNGSQFGTAFSNGVGVEAGKCAIPLAGRGVMRLRCHIRNSRTFNWGANPIETGTFRSGSTTTVLNLAAGGGVGVGGSHYVQWLRASDGNACCVKVKAVSGAGGSTPTFTMANFSSLPTSWVPVGGETYYISTQPPQGDGHVEFHLYDDDGTEISSMTKTNLVTGTPQNDSRGLLVNSNQKIDRIQYCRNMNQGPVGHSQDMWWSYNRSYDTDPGWGW